MDPLEHGEPASGLLEGRLVLSAAEVRKQLGLAQQQFADMIGVPIDTVRGWEEGLVLPDPVARTLLTILAREPQAAIRALDGHVFFDAGGIRGTMRTVEYPVPPTQ